MTTGTVGGAGPTSAGVLAHAAETERVGHRASSEKTWVALILVVALIIRVAIVIATKNRYVPVQDAADFSRIATSISRGHGFGSTIVPTLKGPSAFRTPLWPGLLGAVYWVTGVSWTAGRLVLAILSTGLVGLIGIVGWKLVGRRVGLLTMVIAAVYPPLLLGGYGLEYRDPHGLHGLRRARLRTAVAIQPDQLVVPRGGRHSLRIGHPVS